MHDHCDTGGVGATCWKTLVWSLRAVVAVLQAALGFKQAQGLAVWTGLRADSRLSNWAGASHGGLRALADFGLGSASAQPAGPGESRQTHWQTFEKPGTNRRAEESPSLMPCWLIFASKSPISSCL
eukprot:1919934-Rhodomonas_salina.2